MARPRRWLLRLLLFVIILIAAAIAIAPFVPLGPLKPAIESRLGAALGRQVTIGSARLNLLGGPYLVIDKLTAKEDPDFGDGNFLQADKVKANVALWPLVTSRQILIEGIELQSPDFTFVKNQAGVWSWATIGKTAAPAAQSASTISVYIPSLIVAAGAAINSIKIEGASVRLIDRTGDEPPETLYKNVALQARVTRQEGRTGSNPTAATSHAKGEMRAQSEEAEGADRLHAEMPFDLEILGRSNESLSLQGSIGPGHLETKNFDADSLKSTVGLKDNRLTLDQMEMNLYDGSLRGRMELDLKTQQFTTEAEVTNLNLDQAISSKLQIPGQITGHINAQFKLAGELRGFQQTVPTLSGGGRMTSSELFVSSVNVSEHVARALHVSDIGDMSAGTAIGSLEAAFQISQGEVRTTGLRIERLDGLGDATADQGSFRVATSPTLSYRATVLLTEAATSRAKSANPLLGAAISILESNKRVAVPVNITGEVRNPAVQVDVSRIF
jgi:uncharacterized protein involved in outer membrane biogenesis